MEDFQKAYEINPELTETFKEAGIYEDFGLIGLTPEDWSQFGPVQKTLSEFKSAYDSFQKEMVSALQKLVRKKRSLGKKGGMKNKSKKRR
jgi:predicted urease superfamily metal-dependent hydrolase